MASTATTQSNSGSDGKTSLDYFSQEFLDQMKEILLTEKAQLEKELTENGRRNPHVPGDFDATFPEYGSEEDDQVHETEEYTVNKALEETMEDKLRDVTAALKRMENGTYGICKYTGKPIDQKRLLARPTSSASVEAKKLLTEEA